MGVGGFAERPAALTFQTPVLLQGHLENRGLGTAIQFSSYPFQSMVNRSSNRGPWGAFRNEAGLRSGARPAASHAERSEELCPSASWVYPYNG